MKRLLLFFYSALLLGCSKDDPPILATVATHEVTSVTQTTAVSGGTVISDGSTIDEFGLVWGTSANPEKGKNAQVPATGYPEFSFTMPGLSPNTTYYVRAFATNDAGIAYGEERSFVTLAHDPPEIQISEVTTITFNSAVVKGEFLSSGTSEVSETGMAFGNLPEPTVDDETMRFFAGVGPVSVSLKNLSENSNYYVRAYAISAAGISYSNELSFATPSSLNLKTFDATSVTFNSASVKGEVSSAGTSNITQRGVVYAKSQHPTIEGAKVVSGSGAGSFTANITGLDENSTYFMRAFATNGFGTSYGNEITVVTKVEALPVSFVGNWFDINGKHKYIVTDGEIVFAETFISYLYGPESITLDGAVYKVSGVRIGWWNDPVIFSLTQGTDLNALSIGSRLSAAQTFWKVVGKTVRSVTYGSGQASLYQTGEVSWTEKNDAGESLPEVWTENARDNWSVYLSRGDGARLRIDINLKALFFSSTPDGPLNEIHKLTSWHNE